MIGLLVMVVFAAAAAWVIRGLVRWANTPDPVPAPTIHVSWRCPIESCGVTVYAVGEDGTRVAYEVEERRRHHMIDRHPSDFIDDNSGSHSDMWPG